MRTRRQFLEVAAKGLLLARTGFAAADLPSGTIASASLETLPGKRALIKRSYRPPNYETPLAAFRDTLTPNEAFFVRWHLANIPEVAAADWRLSVGGDAAAKPYELTLAELRSDFEPVELVAVCQCAGVRRGLVDPHAPGVQWGVGAMGNARWKGVRLRDLLARAGIAKDAVEVSFQGGDRAPLEATPPFVKSLPAWKAMDDTTLVAYEMNGAPLPHWNGYPARMVVAGWMATYWTKQVTTIRALAAPFAGFWMKSAYRVPKGRYPLVDRFVSQEAESTTPVTEIPVNSLLTSHADGERVAAGRAIVLRGIAWDGGAGVRRVLVSVDEGRSFLPATLGEDLGRYSFRPWELAFTPRTRGSLAVMVVASNAQGVGQPFEWAPNPSGYHNNVVTRTTLEVA
jgi:DMSO/TMAO reductase YedYZ molybdopterin-dependent catalytic subunit